MAPTPGRVPAVPWSFWHVLLLFGCVVARSSPLLLVGGLNNPQIEALNVNDGLVPESTQRSRTAFVNTSGVEHPGPIDVDNVPGAVTAVGAQIAYQLPSAPWRSRKIVRFGEVPEAAVTPTSTASAPKAFICNGLVLPDAVMVVGACRNTVPAIWMFSLVVVGGALGTRARRS